MGRKRRHRGKEAPPESRSGGQDDNATVRLDRWLWAARFVKTRPLAVEAISGGKAHLNGQRAKPGKAVKVGDRLEITKGRLRFDITVLGLPERRGPATEARTLYEEDAESIVRRQKQSEQRRMAALSMPQTGGRPTKRDRREMDRLKWG
ncbi:MAG: RNA-binding protein [Magnetococcales bacterium]|nr:RNA-binding protein [Magnetococcales bacterium]